MKALTAFVVLLVAFVLQAQVGSRIAPPMYRPDLVFAVVLAGALLLSGKTLVFLAFTGGFLDSVLLGQSVGAFIVSRLIAALVAQTLIEPLEISLPVIFGVAVLASGVGNLVFLLVQPSTDLLWWLNVSLRQSLLTALLVSILTPFGLKSSEKASVQ